MWPDDECAVEITADNIPPAISKDPETGSWKKDEYSCHYAISDYLFQTFR